MPIWKTENTNDNLYSSLLLSINELLYNNKKDKSYIKELGDRFRNFFEDISNSPAGLSGLSLIALLNSILYDAAPILNIDEYSQQDDNSFDWDVWTPDFIASIVKSEGNPFLNEGNISKRKEFWTWYLDIALNLYNDSSVAVLPIVFDQTEAEKPLQIPRVQTYNHPNLIEDLKRVITLSIKDLESSSNQIQWEKIELIGECMKGGLSMKGFYSDQEGLKTPFTLKYYLYKGDESSVNIMNKIKYTMYEQAPNEGAWFGYILTTNRQLDFKLNTNYDDISVLPESRQRPDILSQEFEAFPRSQEFTPEWLQNIVKKYKLKYL